MPSHRRREAACTTWESGAHSGDTPPGPGVPGVRRGRGRPAAACRHPAHRRALREPPPQRERLLVGALSRTHAGLGPAARRGPVRAHPAGPRPPASPTPRGVTAARAAASSGGCHRRSGWCWCCGCTRAWPRSRSPRPSALPVERVCALYTRATATLLSGPVESAAGRCEPAGPQGGRGTEAAGAAPWRARSRRPGRTALRRGARLLRRRRVLRAVTWLCALLCLAALAGWLLADRPWSQPPPATSPTVGW